MGATASILSDERFRGYSLSEDRPVASVDFGYDNPRGFYADAAASAVFRDGGRLAPLALQLSGGYAKRLASGTTLDFGVTHSSYTHYSTGRLKKSYTEVYAGIARGVLSSRIFLSPHYFQTGRWAAYGEVDANFSPAHEWSLDAHIGMLSTLRTPSDQKYHTNVDWSVGVGREFGRFSLHAAWVGHARAPQPFGSALRNARRTRSKTVVLGITTAI